ncbi:MAG: TatD family hydrolase [Prevotellaceae bacterium]|jgi:TatD DNase family protein|nr:TatD family hydrolase [Prevotellaceae bacterium]
MNRLLDIHTHHLPLQAGTAIVNCPPETFAPQPGQWYSVGIHPWHVGERTFDAEVVRRLLAHPQVLAVGEAGLDKLVSTPMAVQTTLFERQVQLSEQLGKPLVIHAVKATEELLALKRQLAPRTTWVIHGFRGKPALAESLLRHGFCLSFGEHYHADALRITPIEALFVETDESEVPVEMLYERAAAVRGETAEQLRTAVSRNISRLFLHE